MKRYLLIALVSLGMISATHAQIRKIPSEVTEAFKAKFPKAEKVEWKDKLTNFEAQFNLDDNEYAADFNSNGEWLETDKKISFEALPEAVKDGFKKSKYADWTPGSVTLIEKKDKTTQYKVYVEKSSLVQKKFLYFNTEGKLDKDAQT